MKFEAFDQARPDIHEQDSFYEESVTSTYFDNKRMLSTSMDMHSIVNKYKRNLDKQQHSQLTQSALFKPGQKGLVKDNDRSKESKESYERNKSNSSKLAKSVERLKVAQILDTVHKKNQDRIQQKKINNYVTIKPKIRFKKGMQELSRSPSSSHGSQDENDEIEDSFKDHIIIFENRSRRSSIVSNNQFNQQKSFAKS